MREMYSCDFEATTKVEDCRVWAWGYMNVNNFNDFEYGTNLDDFMIWLCKGSKDCYFHNLKYDGSFILNWLLKNDYSLDRRRKPNGKTFNTTISENGQWYKIEITSGYTSKGAGKDKRIFTTVFDSLKKLPFPVKRIAKAFNLPVLKGEIDYNKERPVGYQLNDNEISYLKNDVEIMARALAIQFEQGLTNITIGTDALKDFKARIKKSQFEKFFPLVNDDVDAFLRQSYKGGFTWVNPKHQGEIIGKGLVYDVNSLYPSVMRFRDLPYGVPIHFTGKYKLDKNYPLYIVKFKCVFELKDGCIPTVQIKNSRFMDNEYLTTTDGEEVTLTMTSVDLELFQNHYHTIGDIEWLEGYKFRKNNSFFNEYIDHWGEVKATSKGAKRELAKLMLNNLYGKFGKNPDVTPKLPYLKNDKSLGLKVPRDEDGFIDREYDDPLYIAMGSFITAYAREVTITTAQKCYDRILYCDTDSIHLMGDEVPEAIKDIIDDNQLGYWAHECTFVKAKFLRQKTYVEMHPTTIRTKHFKLRRLVTDIKCAGMPDRIKRTLTFDEFKIGLYAEKGKLIPKQVPGGVVLVDTPFTLK